MVLRGWRELRSDLLLNILKCQSHYKQTKISVLREHREERRGKKERNRGHMAWSTVWWEVINATKKEGTGDGEQGHTSQEEDPTGHVGGALL